MKLFTKNNCSACNNVKAYLKAQGVDYEEVNIQKDGNAAADLVSAGFRSVPIVQYGEYYLVGVDDIKASIH